MVKKEDIVRIWAVHSYYVKLDEKFENLFKATIAIL